MNRYILFLGFCLGTFQSMAGEGILNVKNTRTQSDTVSVSSENINHSLPSSQSRSSRKGDFYIHTGFNWDAFAKSDLHFKGQGYDFILNDVKANHQPYHGSLQYNIRLGYFLNDNYSISIGFDHMKYVMKENQVVTIKGQINPTVSSPAISTGSYAGNYNGESITISKDFLTYEHTDGLNYASLEGERYDDLWMSKSGKKSLTIETGLGAGLIVPRSDVRLFRVGENNMWNIAGFGISGKAGLKYFFNKTFYLQGSVKAGYIDLYHVRTTGINDQDKASQKINFLQGLALFGFQF